MRPVYLTLLKFMAIAVIFFLNRPVEASPARTGTGGVIMVYHGEIIYYLGGSSENSDCSVFIFRQKSICIVAGDRILPAFLGSSKEDEHGLQSLSDQLFLLGAVDDSGLLRFGGKRISLRFGDGLVLSEASLAAAKKTVNDSGGEQAFSFIFPGIVAEDGVITLKRELVQGLFHNRNYLFILYQETTTRTKLGDLTRYTIWNMDEFALIKILGVREFDVVDEVAGYEIDGLFSALLAVFTLRKLENFSYSVFRRKELAQPTDFWKMPDFENEHLVGNLERIETMVVFN